MHERKAIVSEENWRTFALTTIVEDCQLNQLPIVGMQHWNISAGFGINSVLLKNCFYCI